MTETPETPRAATPTHVPLGTLINNNYRVEELINAGGMGEVFRGTNVHSGDEVAIKIVLQSLAHDEKVAALFRREARVLCQLSDQAIVRYYNFVHDAALDRFCLIMQFIDGVPLSEHVKQTAPLTLAEAQRLIRRLALGLDRAHAMDVVHRDLSPDNVMLPGGKVDNAVLIDFGIAKSTEMAESTLFGQMAGKFKYVSPEQLGHFGGEIGPRTDIYGLALLMAAAVRGEPIDMGGSVVEAVNARRAIPDLTGVYPELRPLFAHMLEPDPAMRPARMSDVIRLMDNPQEIPPQYGAVAATDRTMIAPIAGIGAPNAPYTPSFVQPGGTQSIAVPVPGLRQPPGRTAAPQIGVGIGQPQTSYPQTAAPQTMAPLPPEPKSRGGMVMILLLAAAAAGGAGFAWQQGLIGASAVVAPDDTPTEPMGDPDPNGNVAPADPAEITANTDTRDGFLSAYDAGACTYAARIDAGPDAGMIQGFATTADGGKGFDGLPDAYDTKFGSKPNVLVGMVSESQCPVLDLARKVQAMGGVSPVVTLDSYVMQAGGSIVGQVREKRGRTIWMVLVSPKGQVFNLTDRLTDQPDGSSTLSFQLNAPTGPETQNYLILTLATDDPLISAAAAKVGAPAATLLPVILTEVQGRGGGAAASLAWFQQKP
ncbi:MAG: serine/threonine-protein kinase [Paracoccaceae bacterium]